MKVTTRFVAEISPEVKKKLQEISKATDKSMTNIIVEFIESEHKRVCK